MAATHQAELSRAAEGRAASAFFALLCFSILTLWIQQRWPLGLFQAGVYLLAAATIARAIWRGESPGGTPLLLPVAIAVALGTVQVAAHWSVYTAATRESLLQWMANGCAVWLGARLFRDRNARRRFLLAIFSFGFAVSVVAILQVWTSGGRVFWLFPTGYSDFVMGPFVSRNLYAAFIELLLPIGLSFAISGRHGLRCGAMCAVMMTSVVAGASRAGLALLALESAAVLLAAWARRVLNSRTLLRAAAAFAIACAAMAAVFGGPAVWRRLQDPDPYGARREMLHSSLAMIRERPWTGFGLGTWGLQYPRFAEYDDGTITHHAHNDWAEWTADGGLPLLASMLAFAALTVRPAVRSLWGIGLLAIWAHCLVDSPMQNPVVSVWCFLLAGIAAADRTGCAT